MRRERFDVVCYAPWAAGLLTGGAAGGGETQLFKVAVGLAARRLRVGMIVVGDELPERAKGVHIIRQARRRHISGPLARGALAIGAFRSMSSVRTRVLIQRNAGPTTGVASLMARLQGARFIYSSSSVKDFEFARYDARGLNVKLYEWGVRTASAVVVQTDEQAEMCRARFGREPVVIPSIAERAERRTAEPDAFLWVGRLHVVKCPGAYLELARAVPEAHFRMIAVPQANDPADLRREVEQAVAELPNLELLEPRSREAVGALLQRTVAVVNTSPREGMPNVFLEGWARGVPALALSFDPDDLIATRGLGWFAGGSPERLADEARRVWRERANQRDVAERVIAYVRDRHGENAAIDRWLELVGRG